jgi:hypothetical protein
MTIKTLTKKVKCSDEWFLIDPSDGTLEVRLSCTNSSPRIIVVNAWGPDDFGMETYFPVVDNQDARKLYDSITDGATMKSLLALGMVQG